jgi:hypothetical protein
VLIASSKSFADSNSYAFILFDTSRHAMSPLIFLDLPAELRNHVYGYLTPIHSYTKGCTGFLLSCKHIYTEYEAEANLRLNGWLANLEREWQSVYHIKLQLGIVNDIATQQKMDVRVPRSMSPWLPTDPRLPRYLKPLFWLHFEHLDFGLYDDDAAANKLGPNGCAPNGRPNGRRLLLLHFFSEDIVQFANSRRLAQNAGPLPEHQATRTKAQILTLHISQRSRNDEMMEFRDYWHDQIGESDVEWESSYHVLCLRLSSGQPKNEAEWRTRLDFQESHMHQ